MDFRARYQWTRVGILGLLLAILGSALFDVFPFLYWLGFVLVVGMFCWVLGLRALTCPSCQQLVVSRNAAGEMDLPMLAPPPRRCARCGTDLS